MPIVRKGETAFPEGFLFREWGVGHFKSGQECDYHYHDCDEYWFMIEGQARVVEDGVDYEIGPGDCVFTPMGSEHKIVALTDCSEFWAEMPLQGQKRIGHLHREPEGTNS
jgi:mannose-6-phosphate isomerase-like protein (cupin superfamily)